MIDFSPADWFICLPYFSLSNGALGLRAVSEPVIPLSFWGTVPIPACSLHECFLRENWMRSGEWRACFPQESSSGICLETDQLLNLFLTPNVSLILAACPCTVKTSKQQQEEGWGEGWRWGDEWKRRCSNLYNPCERDKVNVLWTRWAILGEVRMEREQVNRLKLEKVSFERHSNGFSLC